MPGQPTLRFRFFSEASESPTPATATTSDIRDLAPTSEALEAARKTWSDARRRLHELEARADGRVFARTGEQEESPDVEQSDAA